jgi:hypothetical protein
MGDFRQMLTERLTKKHGSRLVEDVQTGTAVVPANTNNNTS